MSIIGILMWRKYTDTGGIVAMKKLSLKGVSVVLIICIAAIIGTGCGLSLLDGQNTPYIDAATNVLAVAATILMNRRYREQWAAYIILNVLSVIMWSVRLTEGSPEGAIMVVMWTAYLVNSVYGLYNWTRGVKKLKEGAAV
jgi:nicotinamide mononucleotide transporter